MMMILMTSPPPTIVGGSIRSTVVSISVLGGVEEEGLFIVIWPVGRVAGVIVAIVIKWKDQKKQQPIERQT